MEKEKQIEKQPDEAHLHLPMGQLFYLLHSNGFKVKPDDYIELLKVTERFGSKNIDETAQWICPIIATSETEQIRFYNVIEQYKKISAAKEAEAIIKKKPFPLWIKIATGACLLLLLLAALYFTRPQHSYALEEANKERTVEKGVLLSLDATNLLQENLADTANIQILWHFEDSSKQVGASVTHAFQQPGDYRVKRQFSSRKLRLSKEADSLLIHVCNDLPKLNIIVPTNRITAQQPINITAEADADDGTISYYQWRINDSVFTTTGPSAQNILFPAKGDYRVECTAVVGDLHAPCTVTDNKIFSVLDNGNHYTTTFSAARPGSYAPPSSVKWWVTLVLLIPAAAALLYSFFKQKIKPPTAQAAPKNAATLNQGPFDIPFEQNDVRLIQPDPELRRTFIQMRYRAEEETMELSVPGTITSIIRSGGSPQLIYAPRTQQQQYLILTDRSNPKSMLTRLFDWLMRTIADQGIPVLSFYHDKDFVCYNEKFPGGISLQRLAETYSNCTLILLGKAHELVYSVYPVIEEKILKELNRWQSKAIITPVPVKDWAIKEKLLQEYFFLLPADTTSLQKLVPALREKNKPRIGLRDVAVAEQYSLTHTDFRNTGDLRNYLNNDETIFQWLCAICVYPRLKWEVLVEIGKAILERAGVPEKLNYGNLLAICRISWMQQGVFPQATRLELLKQLSIENEICARETILRMLSYSSSVYGETGYFFEEEKSRQQLTNQFVLHASNSVQYHQYAASRDAFKKLWKRKVILDMPLKKYLDKTGSEQWQTPVNDGTQSVGLSAYFNLHEVTINKTLKLRRVLAAGLAILLISLWGYISYGDGAEKLSGFITVNKDPGEQNIPVAIKIIKDFAACGDTAAKTFAQISGYLEIENQQFPLSFAADKSVAAFSVPFKSMRTGKASLLLRWDSSKTVTVPLVFADQLLPDSVSIGCLASTTAAKIPLNIRFNDTSAYRKIELTLADALNRYNIAAEYVAFTDSSRIVYYETNQKTRADSVVQILKQHLGINVAEEFISENRTPPAVPILFLNTGVDTSLATQPVAGTTEDADSYHRMGDQYYNNKQYQQAVREYTRALMLNPKDELALFQRGVSYEMMGTQANAEKAVADYNAAILLNDKNVAYRYRRASTLYYLKRYTTAIQDFNKVIAINAPEAKTQYNYSVYFRGRSYYYLNNLTSACKDFKRAGELGIAAGKKDYAAYCDQPALADCNRTFTSLKEALLVNAAVVCKLDLSKEKISVLPAQLYTFKNLRQLNLGNTSISETAITQLQKALPACKITYTAAREIETNLGNITLDRSGYTDAAGQQVMQKVSGLLKAQPLGKIRLTASYETDSESKTLTGYMNTIVDMFEKIGVNPKTQIIRQLNKLTPQVRQGQQNVFLNKTFQIQVTGINLSENQNKAGK
ncbi:MAG: tetratricopeptide repeat protein [Chitinophagaceae bacterium]